MFGAFYTFALMLLAYAILPHEYITFSDKYLQWSTDKYVIKSTTQIPCMHAGTGRSSINLQAMRDVVVVGIYLVFFAGNIALDRHVAEPQDEDGEQRGEAGRGRAAPGSAVR